MNARHRAEILPTRTPVELEVAVRRAAELLRAGELVALPTETVYGLAACALDPAAVAKIYAVKSRPALNPIIVHVSSVEMARICVLNWSRAAQSLADTFWPGPLTLVLLRSSRVPVIVTAGGETVGVRWPSHPVMQAVIRECDFPLAAPSANLSSELSPTQAGHVQRSLGDKIRLIIDGGPAQVGIESTVLDVSSSPPRILRPGMIDARALRAVLGETQEISSMAQFNGTAAGPLQSPGLFQKHYSPKARLVIWKWPNELELLYRLGQEQPKPVRAMIIAHTGIPTSNSAFQVKVLPREPASFAQAIYSALHQGDAEGADLIVVEAPPETPEWQAISDRLRRASAQAE